MRQPAESAVKVTGKKLTIRARAPGTSQLPPDRPDAPLALTALIEAAKVRTLFAQAPLAMAMGFGTASLYLALLSQERTISLAQAGIWEAAHGVAVVAGEFIAFRGSRVSPSQPQWRFWIRAYLAISVVAGLVWTVGAILLFPPADPAQALLLGAFLLAQACGAALGTGALESAAFAYILPVTLPMALWFVAQSDERRYDYGVVSLLFVGALAVLVHQFNRTHSRTRELEVEREALIDELKERTRLAEEASQSKSRFLASASHDLRQPVHALGMFVGALREQGLPRESARLVDHISGSIESLDSLFASLLDISKLDAGALQVRPQSFAVGPMLRRIATESTIDAAGKGLRLKAVPSSVIVRADPVLLETVLRNLVSNAIRYTDRGRVVIGCRRGARLRIEVLDTGRGIAETDLERVFEEFYQIGNPERDRSRGLGLGLAIVKRISALIGCDLELESELGRGTRVSLSVPVAEGPAPELPTLAPVEAADAGGVIFVIDDEASIREGMKSLLTSWGYRTITAESGRQIFADIAESALRPDLIICDLRLRDGEDGVELMQRLRREFNDEISGIVITGDAAPGRVEEAAANGCLVLHKPLSSARLRSAIRALIAQSRLTGERETSLSEAET